MIFIGDLVSQIMTEALCGAAEARLHGGLHRPRPLRHRGLQNAGPLQETYHRNAQAHLEPSEERRKYGLNAEKVWKETNEKQKAC